MRKPIKRKQGTEDREGEEISAALSKYVSETEKIDPKVIFSAIGKRIKLESQKLRGSARRKS